MSNIIPPMVSSSPPPMDDNIDDDEDDEFGDFTSANLSYDIGGDDEDENFVEIGTPLDPFDEDAPVQKKPFSMEDQVAKDSHGRRRFHGAFTGGFSAGFFNTVGSLEGWTPSSFKSSRLDRADLKIQKPQDFMDDEDVGEFGIAPSVLRATSDFGGRHQKRKHEPVHPSDGPIPGKPVLQDLLEPVRETVGIKLLRRMGWKPGQGIGPRVSRVEKKRMKQDQKKTSVRVYGCALPGDVPASASDSSDEECVKNLTFAPDDCDQFFCMQKDNVFGIGYSGLDKRPVLSGHINLFAPSSLVMNEKKKKVSIYGQAFGVGALEKEDEDIYAVEDMSQYDFSLETASSSRIKQKQGSRFSSNVCIGEILEGFVRGCSVSAGKRYFPPPELPVGFQPIHSTHTTRFNAVSNEKDVARRSLTASDRSAILSEQTVALSTEVPSEVEEKQLIAQAQKITENLVPVLSKGSSQFRPFMNCPEKQKRYEQYAALSNAGQKEKLVSLQPLNMTEWEKERERTEFEQALKLFTPLSGPMSERFVSAVQPDDTTNPLTPVENLVDENTEKKSAVKMKMFGRLTRERTSWQPCSLLCRRFNIAEPNVSNLPASVTSKKMSRFSVFDYLDASVSNKQKPVEELRESVLNKQESEESRNSPQGPAEIQTGKSVEEEKTDSQLSIKPVEEEITFPDPPEKIDLYKAIFLSSSDESEVEEEEEEKEEEVNDIALAHTVTIPSVKRNTSPPRGVFANLDLDVINIRKPVQSNPEPPKSPEVKSTNGEMKDKLASEEDRDVYGPRLPSHPLPQPPVQEVSKNVMPSSVVVPPGEWVEKRKKHKNKHHHKKEHKKSSKHKSKKSKKKK